MRVWVILVVYMNGHVATDNVYLSEHSVNMRELELADKHNVKEIIVEEMSVLQ